jgi:hypothetical protein
VAKTASQLDADIRVALHEDKLEREREGERAKLTEDFNKLSPRNQEVVLRVQEIAAFGEMLTARGLHMKHLGRGKNGRIEIWGKPTYQLRDVLKKYGFYFDGSTKRWNRPTDYSARPSDIDYLTFYNDLVRKL